MYCVTVVLKLKESHNQSRTYAYNGYSYKLVTESTQSSIPVSLNPLMIISGLFQRYS